MRLYTSIARCVAAGSLIAISFLAGCSDDSPTSQPTQTYNATPVLTNLATNVILATYADLDGKSIALAAAVQTLHDTPTADNLTNARNAWRNARRPWEQNEAFLFGPVETQGIDPGIDSWPVNKADLDNVLAGDAVLTKGYIDGLEGTLKGFHTIEYLLFGAHNDKTIEQMTPRELEYLTAVTLSFQGATHQLYLAWSPTGGNYTQTLATGGASGNSIYTSQKSALQEVLNGMIGICDEVANGKIADPYSQQDRSLEESQFSDNSNADFQDNIRSVQNMYLGVYGTSGTPNGSAGLYAVVAARDTALAATVRAKIDTAISAIGQMTPTFGSAIFSNKTKVEAAQAAINEVKSLLENQVRSVVAPD